jgi:glc operon protein GlcG
MNERTRRLLGSGSTLLALLVASAAIATESSSSDAVRYFDHETVAAAFDRGAVLDDGSGRNYMVHASRREAPGKAEIHTRDTDIIYALAGSATLVTGGLVVGGETIAPDEVRGSAIEGGEKRRLRAGDVIIVPNGTPHWFQEVAAPFTYYVVKVR